MKKILFVFCAALLFSFGASAQTTKMPPAKMKTEKSVKKETTQTATTPATTTTTSTDAKMKKDGTPDMRYKDNKTVKKGPTKSDGTLDKRYKANKKG